MLTREWLEKKVLRGYWYRGTTTWVGPGGVNLFMLRGRPSVWARLRLALAARLAPAYPAQLQGLILGKRTSDTIAANFQNAVATNNDQFEALYFDAHPLLPTERQRWWESQVGLPSSPGLPNDDED